MRRYRAAVGVTGAFFAIMVAASFYWAGAGTVTGEAETLLVFFATILFGATVHAYQSDQASRMVDFGATAALALSVTHGVPGLVIDPGMGWIPAVTIVGLVGGGLLCRWSSGFAVTQVIARALPRIVTVAILAVLQYVDHAAQLGVLDKVRGGLAPRVRLLLRVGDAANQRGFAISQWVDHVVTVARGHRVPPTWGRTLPEWKALLQGLGFVVRSIPQSQGTPFANVLLVADLQGGA